jgi:catechol 2,3-dioxygenase
MTISVEPHATAAAPRLHPDTSLGAVSLTVSDLARSREFYERAVGLRAREREDGGVGLGVDGSAELVRLYGDPTAPKLDRRATGLFHLAILLPGRRELAMALARLAQARWPLDGASDHLVSEALYLSDPDGNGVEIYRDRPREQWRYSDGELQMATLRLDLDDVLGELTGVSEIDGLAPTGTTIGHVHLQVAELARIEQFYDRVIGLDVTVRGYPGALFMSAGGYHHHLGLNTWNSAGASPPAPGAVGLRDYELRLADRTDLERILARAGDAGVPVEDVEGEPRLRDPSGNAVRLLSPA